MVFKNKKGVDLSAISHPILAIAVLIVAITIGVTFYNNSVEFGSTGIDKLIETGDGDFVIEDPTQYYTKNDKIVLSSSQAFIKTVNSLATGEVIRADLEGEESEFDLKVTDYQISFWVELDNGQEKILSGERQSISNYVTYVKAPDGTRDIDRVINMFLKVWYSDGTTEQFETAKTYPYSYVQKYDNDRRSKTIHVSTSDPYEGDDLLTWAGPQSSDDRDEDGSPSSEEGCKDSPTVVSIPNMGVEAYYCGKGMDVIKAQIYACSDCAQTSARRDNSGLTQFIVDSWSNLFGDGLDAVANSENVFCKEGILYPEDAPEDEQVCIQCEPDKNPPVCYIEGFEFPQNVTQDTSFGTIAGQGDPTYLFYHQEFPIGAEQAWQMDKLSTFAYSKLAVSVTLGVVGGSAGAILGGAYKLVKVGSKAVTIPVSFASKRIILLAKLGREVPVEDFSLFQKGIAHIKDLVSKLVSTGDEFASVSDEILAVVKREGGTFSDARDAVFLRRVGQQLDTALENSDVFLDDVAKLSSEARKELLDSFLAHSAKSGENAGKLSTDKRLKAFMKTLENSNYADEFAPLLKNDDALKSLVDELGDVGFSVFGPSTQVIQQYARVSQSFREKFLQYADEAVEGAPLAGATLNKKALSETLSKQVDYIFDNVEPSQLSGIVKKAVANAPPEDVRLVSAAVGNLGDEAGATLKALESSFGEVLEETAVKSSLGRVRSEVGKTIALGEVGLDYSASVALTMVLLWEDSINDKYTNEGINNMVLNTPSFYPVVSTIDDNKEYSFINDVLQYPILLDRYGRDQESLDRFMIASPCKTDMVIEKVACNCNAELALAQKNEFGEYPYELRLAEGTTDHWIPTKGVVTTEDKVFDNVDMTVTEYVPTYSTYSAYDPYSGATAGLQSMDVTYTFVRSSGGDDTHATYQCTVDGELGDKIYDSTLAVNTCIIVTLQKDSYEDYNGGYNYCYMRDSTGKYLKQGAIMGLQFLADGVITSLVGAACGGTAGIGCGPATLLGMAGYAATSGLAYTLDEKIAEDYMWPKGGTN